MAGKHYNPSYNGGGANFLCLPNDPVYSIPQNNGPAASLIYGAQYGGYLDPQPFSKVNKISVPCAVCRARKAKDVVMIPAKLACPKSWDVEYTGYISAESSLSRDNRYPSEYICVDKELQTLGGTVSSWGAVVYQVGTSCTMGGLPCPPYSPDKELSLSCVVCTTAQE